MSDEIVVTGKSKEIEIARLNIRYIPVLTPIEIWKAGVMSIIDLMNITTSPHVELMKIFRDYGKDWNMILRSRYVEERRYRREKGMSKWTEEYIQHHIRRRYDVFKSIKQWGYKASKCKSDPIKVLKEPFWKTRFGANDLWLHGREIWNGAGRCSAAYVLGHKSITVAICEDRYPGSGVKGNFDSKLREVDGVFNGNDSNSAV